MKKLISIFGATLFVSSFIFTSCGTEDTEETATEEITTEATTASTNKKKQEGYIICGMQKVNHLGGTQISNEAGFEDYMDISDTPILLIIFDNTTEISIVMVPTTSTGEDLDHEILDFKFYQAYKDGESTFTNYYSTENNSQFTIETPKSGIPRSFILGVNEDYSVYFYNDCTDEFIINYFKNNPNKFESIQKIF